MPPFLRRARGALLRLIRRRATAMIVGVALVAVAVWIQVGAAGGAWWLDGLGLIAGATGIALFWTGLAGLRPDWVDDDDLRGRR